MNKRELKLFTREWTDHNIARKGVVVLVHGYSFHSAYFEPVASRLVAEGVNALTQGQGRTEYAI